MFDLIQTDLDPVPLVCKDGKTIVFIKTKKDIIAFYNESMLYQRLTLKGSTLFVDRSNHVIEVNDKQSYIQVRWFDDLFGSYQKQKADKETECQ